MLSGWIRGIVPYRLRGPGARPALDPPRNLPTSTALTGTNEDDADGDGFSTCGGDCADDDDTRWARPGEVRALVFVDPDSLQWDIPTDPGALAGRLTYDVTRSDSPVDLDMGAVCVVSEQPGTSATDNAEPAAGDAYVYLSRARNDCPNGIGPWGRDSDGNERFAGACPWATHLRVISRYDAG